MSSKKKVRLGHIDADSSQFALIVNYTTELTHLDEFGNPVGTETTPGQKVVRVPRNLSSGDIPKLAQEIVDKCKYIHANKVGEVQRLLCNLMDHEQAMSHGPPGGHGDSKKTRSAARNDGEPRREGKSYDEVLPQADVRFIEEYADSLYEEDMELKVHGAKCILRVCTEPMNLEFLAEHDTLLQALSRELRESSKKSFELSVTIVCSFLCFSHFSQFHPILMQHQCGDVTMRVVEYESQRHQVRKEDMERRIHRVKELGAQITSEDKRQIAKDDRKYKIQMHRQNRLMYVCLMALLNLAEEISIEKKMVNRKMPKLLVSLLDRTHEDLVLLALHFLKKLSVFEENKETISTPETLSHLVQLAQHGNVRLALLSLRVLYNLSFDIKVRASLVESGIVKILVDHLRNPPFRHIVLRLLYHFSMDDKCKSLMAYYQDGMIMLLQLVVHFPEPRVGKDLVALVVNLATHPRAAEVMMGSGLFPQVMLRVLKTRDPLLCKVIRHVSSHEEVKEPLYDLLQSDSVRMSRWMNEYVRMALCCVDNPDLLVEVLGTLSNMTLPDVPWGELCEAGLVDLLHRLLVPSFSEDDIVLECIMIIGNLALTKDSATRVAGSRLSNMLQDLLVEKREDEEIIAQLLFTFYCLVQHDEVRDVILHETEIAPCVMRFARARNPAILHQAMQFLQVVSEFAGETGGMEGAPSWADQIKAFRFEQHNGEWCHYVNRENSGAGGSSPGAYYDDQSGGDEDDEEEFAFHWAGGDAGDVQDLANRDWGNKHMMGTGMHDY